MIRSQSHFRGRRRERGGPLLCAAPFGPFRQKEFVLPGRSGWETVDEWLLGALVAVVAWLVGFAAWPGLSWEIAGQVVAATSTETANTWIALSVVAAALLVSLSGGAIGKGLIGLLITGAAGTCCCWRRLVR
jgi:hypothetical protein